MKLLSPLSLSCLSVVCVQQFSIAQSLSLEEATRMMLNFEPELNAAEYDTLSAMEDSKVSRADRLPQVALRGSTGVSNRDRSLDGLVRSGETLYQRQIGLSVRQLLLDGGVSANNVRASKNAIMAQQYLEKAMIEARTVDLAEVYMEVLRTRKLIDLADENIDNHAKMVSLLREKLNNGGSRSEYHLAQSRLEQAKNSVASAKFAHEHAVSRLSRLIGHNSLNLSYPVIPPLPSEMREIDLEDNWDFLAAAEALEEVEHRANAAKAAHKPKVYFDAGYTVGRDVSGIRGQDDEASALIVGQWDLFSGGRKRALEKRAHFQVGKFEELKRSAKLGARYDLELLWQERVANQNSIDFLSNHKSELAKVLGDAKELFSVGQEDLMNILNLQSDHNLASTSLVNSRYDYDTSTFRIMGKQGKLAEWLLRLGSSESEANYSENSKNPQINAIPVSLEVDERLKDTRVPKTQKELMKRVFDREGPTAEYEPSPMEEYYEKESNSRKGWFQQIFKKPKMRRRVSRGSR